MKLKKYYSWKYIPVIFLVWLSLEIAVIYYTSYSLPEFGKIGYPTTFEKAQKLALVLRNYLSTSYFTLLLFQTSSFLFLQTWCIPGTFLFNLLGGALFGMYVGFPICLACNTIGALCAFMLSKYFLGEALEKIMKKRKNVEQTINGVKRKIEENKDDLFFYMVSSRIFPGSPNWAMNLSFPHLDIPVYYFVPSIIIGLAPWNFLTCKAGEIIGNFHSRDEIITTSTYVTLIGIALMFLVPPLIRNIYGKVKKAQVKRD